MNHLFARLWHDRELVVDPQLMKVTAKDDRVLGAACIGGELWIGSVGDHAVTLPPLALCLGDDVCDFVGD